MSNSSNELMKARRFLPLFLTQFFGALNDNLFKNALLVMIVSASIAGAANVNTVVNLAAGLFILPFFLFSALAGQLADKYEKSLIIRRIKLAEMVRCSLATVGSAVSDGRAVRVFWAGKVRHFTPAPR